MSDRVTFVGTYAIPADRFEEWSTAIKDMTDFVSQNSPGLMSFDTYLNDERTEGTTIYVHRDTESFEQHLQLAESRISAGTQMVCTLRVELYGNPSDRVVQQLREHSRATTSFPVIVKREFYGSNRAADASSQAPAASSVSVQRASG